MDALVRARREADWPTVVALAEAARAHLEMASFLWQVSSAPAGLAGRQGQRWAGAAGIDRRESAEEESTVGAKERRAARARLAATIANEIRAGGGKVAEDNPHVKRVQGEVAE